MLRHFVPTTLTPEAFEKAVKEILELASGGLRDFQTAHRAELHGVDGDYEIDVTARFEALGAHFLVLIECKHTRRPVEREAVQVLRDRLQSTGAHKGMLFSTAGFQQGAIVYAQVHGIALITIVEGKSLFEVRGVGRRPEPPPWIRFPDYSGIMVRLGEAGSEHYTTVDVDHIDPMREFLHEPRQAI